MAPTAGEFALTELTLPRKFFGGVTCAVVVVVDSCFRRFFIPLQISEMERKIMTSSATTLAEIIPDLPNDDDAALARRVRTYLVNRHVPALRHLRVSVDRGVVTLSGRVSTFYEKQLSHASARRVAGVRRVLDQVRVVPRLRTHPQARRAWTYNIGPDAAWTPRAPR